MQKGRIILEDMAKRPDQWLFYAFLLTLPFSIKKIIYFAPINGRFYEFTSASIYLSEILLFMSILLYVILSHGFRLLSSYKDFILTYRRKKIFFSISLLIFLSFLSALWSEDKTLAVFKSFKLLEVFIVATYVAKNVPRGTFLRNFLYINSMSGIFHSITAIIQYLKQSSLGLYWLKESVINQHNIGVAKIIIDGNTYVRAYGLFPHPNILGAYLVFTSFCTLALAVLLNINKNVPRGTFLHNSADERTIGVASETAKLTEILRYTAGPREVKSLNIEKSYYHFFVLFEPITAHIQILVKMYRNLKKLVLAIISRTAASLKKISGIVPRGTMEGKIVPRGTIFESNVSCEKKFCKFGSIKMFHVEQNLKSIFRTICSAWNKLFTFFRVKIVPRGTIFESNVSCEKKFCKFGSIKMFHVEQKTLPEKKIILFHVEQWKQYAVKMFHVEQYRWIKKISFKKGRMPIFSLFTALFLGLQILAIILTFSKNSLFALVISFAVMLAINCRQYITKCSTWNILGLSKKSFLLFSIILLIILVKLLVFINLDINSLLLRSVSDRLQMLHIYSGIPASNLIIGLGSGQYSLFMYHFFGLSDWLADPIHNVFLLILAENGFAYLILFIYFIILVFSSGLNTSSCAKNMFHVEQSMNHHDVGVASVRMCMASVFISFLFIFFFDHFFWDIQQGQLLFALVIGLLI